MARMEISRVYTFEAAHSLPKLPPTHKCHRLHGHSFRVVVHIAGPVDEALGWVEDYWVVDTAFKPLHDILDHSHLNEIDGLDNPTSENIARWIWVRLQKTLPGLSCVMVQETPDTGCAYRGD